MNIRIIYIFFSVLIFFFNFEKSRAVEDNIDTAFVLMIDSIPDDTNKVENILNYIDEKNYAIGNITDILRYGFNLSVKLGYDKGIVEFYTRRAMYFIERGEREHTATLVLHMKKWGAMIRPFNFILNHCVYQNRLVIVSE